MKTLNFITLLIILTSTELFALKVSIRTYCFYVPKAALNKSPDEQIRAASNSYEKLMDVDGANSLKVSAEFIDKTFQVDEKSYLSLFNKCSEQIKDKGQVLDVKGSDAGYLESLTYFYRIALKGTNESQLLALDDPAVVANLGPGIDPAVLSNAIAESAPTVASMATKLKNSGMVLLQPIRDAVGPVIGSEKVQIVLSIAAVIAAAWFAPAYVAGAVDVLYPLVYGALFGVPSKFGLTYWTVYYPGKVHAVAWAYNHATLIGGLVGAVASAGQSWLVKKIWPANKTASKEELKANLQQMNNAIPTN